MPFTLFYCRYNCGPGSWDGWGLECLPWNILDLCRFQQGPRVTTGLTGNHVCFSRSLFREILIPAVDNDLFTFISN